MFNSSNKFKIKKHNNDELWDMSVTLTGNNIFHLKLCNWRISSYVIFPNERYKYTWRQHKHKQSFLECVNPIISSCLNPVVFNCDYEKVLIEVSFEDYTRIGSLIGISTRFDGLDFWDYKKGVNDYHPINKCLSYKTPGNFKYLSLVDNINIQAQTPDIHLEITFRMVKNKLTIINKIVINMINGSKLYWDCKLTNRLFINLGPIYDDKLQLFTNPRDYLIESLSSYGSFSDIWMIESIDRDMTVDFTITIHPELLVFLLYNIGFIIRREELLICGLKEGKMSYYDYLIIEKSR